MLHLRKQFGITYYLRKGHSIKSKESVIYCRIKIDNIRKAFSTGIYIFKSEWDRQNQRLYRFSRNSLEINNELNRLYYNIADFYIERININGEINHSDIYNQLFLKDVEVIEKIDRVNPIIFTLFDKYEQELNSRCELQLITKSFIRSITYSIVLVKKYIITYYTPNSFRLKDADGYFFSSFESYLIREKNLNVNTTNRTAQHILSIINYSFKSGWINNKPHIVLTTKYKNPRREVLTLDEIRLLEKHTFQTEKLEEAKDCALFQLYTGLAYAEIRNLKCQHIKDIYGKKWIIINRKKTGNESKLVLLPIPLNIISKYEKNEFCLKMNQVLPVVCNLNYNKRLKIIQKELGITTKISSHILRHSFSTTIALSLGLSMESLSLVLGHNNLKTTAIYGRINEKKLMEEFSKIELNLNADTLIP